LIWSYVKLTNDQIVHTNGLMKELLSTAEAARLAGIAPSSVKRWADQGLLSSVRTAGGHRRYDRQALERFLQSQAMTKDGLVSGWVKRLVAARAYEVQGALLEARGRLGAWHRVGDELAPVIEEIGRSWATGRITIAQEHAASECLTRSLAWIAGAISGAPSGPRCLLACVGEEQHTLALSFLELCLIEIGWDPLWIGSRTPLAEVLRIAGSGQVEAVALSASSASNDARALAEIADQVGAACRGVKAELVIGGSGAWPDSPSYGARVRSFREFNAVMAAMQEAT
jgi:excisionase family DNA binding protein